MEARDLRHSSWLLVITGSSSIKPGKATSPSNETVVEVNDVTEDEVERLALLPLLLLTVFEVGPLESKMIFIFLEFRFMRSSTLKIPARI